MQLYLLYHSFAHFSRFLQYYQKNLHKPCDKSRCFFAFPKKDTPIYSKTTHILPVDPIRKKEYNRKEINRKNRIFSPFGSVFMKPVKKILSLFLSLLLALAGILPLISITANAGSFLLYWPVPDSAKVSAGIDDGRDHGAIDIAAPKGTPVIAAGPGTVTLTFTGCTHNFGKNYNCCYSLGNHVRILHSGSIGGSSYSTRYGHLTEVYVKEGDTVQAGQIIGTVGSTGYSTGNHLDFKFYIGDSVADPAPYLQVPSNLSYIGSDWANNSSFIQSLRAYGSVNTTYGGPVSTVTPPNQNTGGSTNTGGSVISSGALYISNYTYPALMKRGAADAGVTGTIVSDSPILAVTAQIITPDNRAVSSVSRTPNTTSFDLSTISKNLNFAGLAAGDYIYEVFATNRNGELRLISQSFIVTAGSGIIIVENSLPNALKPGQSFTVKGEIISINPLTGVTAAVLDENGKAVLSRSVAPSGNSYDLSKLDADLKFNTLADGIYTYRVTASDNAGNNETLIEKTFYVSDKTLISGEVTISGLGWLGSSSAVLSSPYTYATLTAEALIDPAGAPLSYQWYADGVAISGATGKTYTVTSSMIGKRLHVKVTAGGKYFGELESEPTQPVLDKNSLIGDIITDITGRPTEYLIDLGDKTVSPALPGTTCNEILEKIVFSTTFTGVFDKDLKEKNGMDTLCTGDSVRSAIGQITISRYYIVVVGDVNGDGEVTTADARSILRHAVSIESLPTAWQKNAADADHINGVTTADARLVLRAALSLEALSAK